MERRPCLRGAEADLVFGVGWIFDHPFEPPPVTVGEILGARVRYHFAGTHIRDLDGVRVEYPGYAGLFDQSGEVYHRRHGNVPQIPWQLRRDGQTDGVRLCG